MKGERILAEGPTVEIDDEWGPYLGPLIDIAGSALAVFFVVAVIILVCWLGVAAFTQFGKTQAAKRIFGILLSVALAGCLVSTMGWSIKSTGEGGAGVGSVGVSGGESEGLEVDDHKPKQWSVEDVQSDGDSDSEAEEESTAEPTEEPTDEPTEETPGGGEPTEQPKCPTGPQSDLVRAAWAPDNC